MKMIPVLASVFLLALAASAQDAKKAEGKDSAPAPAATAPAAAPPSDSAPPMPGSQEKADQPETKSGGNGLPTEVVIKGEEGGANKLGGNQKPPLNMEVDPYESIRPSLLPDQSLLLAVSPLTVSWRRTHPEFLANERVIQPWRTTFSQRPGVVFRVRDELSDVLQRRIDPKEARGYAWSLTVADEEGRVFHSYQGSSDPPEEQIWTGQNEQGEWIRAGRSYSAVYTFTDSNGSQRTSVGKPLLFRGIVHQEDTGMHLSLDSQVLFGTGKTSSDIAQPAGMDVLRSAADLIKRRFTGIPVSVRVFAQTKELADAQANAVFNYLVRELMLASRNISVDAARAGYSDQRVEIILLNR